MEVELVEAAKSDGGDHKKKHKRTKREHSLDTGDVQVDSPFSHICFCETRM